MSPLQREYEDRLRARAFEKAKVLETNRLKEEEEKALADAFEAERVRHLKGGTALPAVPLPTHLAPKEVTSPAPPM